MHQSTIISFRRVTARRRITALAIRDTVRVARMSARRILLLQHPGIRHCPSSLCHSQSLRAYSEARALPAYANGARLGHALGQDAFGRPHQQGSAWLPWGFPTAVAQGGPPITYKLAPALIGSARLPLGDSYRRSAPPIKGRPVQVFKSPTSWTHASRLCALGLPRGFLTAAAPCPFTGAPQGRQVCPGGLWRPPPG
jgi:hypothetical protein